MKKSLLIIKIVLLIVLVGNIIGSIIKYTPSNKWCKKYLIENKNNITQESVIGTQQIDGYYSFSIINIKNSYFTDITIRLDKNRNYYYVVFWGNRDSWMWRLKLDKDFSVDVGYNEYKGKNVKLDLELLKILKEEKLNIPLNFNNIK